MAVCDFVIFDLDGTLVDSAPDIAWALGAALTEAGVEPPPLSEFKHMVGDGARALIERALQRAGVARDVDALLARYADDGVVTGPDRELVRQLAPATLLQRVLITGESVDDDLLRRLVDHVLMPLLTPRSVGRP